MSALSSTYLRWKFNEKKMFHFDQSQVEEEIALFQKDISVLLTDYWLSTALDYFCSATQSYQCFLSHRRRDWAETFIQTAKKIHLFLVQKHLTVPWYIERWKMADIDVEQITNPERAWSVIQTIIEATGTTYTPSEWAYLKRISLGEDPSCIIE